MRKINTAHLMRKINTAHLMRKIMETLIYPVIASAARQSRMPV
jgi:hypothetical protein